MLKAQFTSNSNINLTKNIKLQLVMFSSFSVNKFPSLVAFIRGS